jgi:alpha-tubulin suppressor-like RCC1 family protein
MDPQYGAASGGESGNPNPSWVTSANARHRCGLSDGVECSGYNPNGETGRVQLDQGRSTWDIWSVGFRQVERLAVSRGVSYAIRFDGSLWCWGNCPSERSWTGGSARATPRPVFGLWNIAEVVVLTGESSYATCARTRDGHVRCWGRCSDVGGRCRNPATNLQEDSLWDFDEPRDVVEIVAGASHFCALTLRDEVWCWGRNRGGESRPGAPESLAGYLPARVTIPN